MVNELESARNKMKSVESENGNKETAIESYVEL